MVSTKRGRPCASIDQTEFEKLCALQCTEKEICSWFDISDDTLVRWCKKIYKMSFADIFDQKREKGRISLRRTQFQLAKKSAAMAIFLGKQYLGQKDKMKASVSVGAEGGGVVICLPDLDPEDSAATGQLNEMGSTGPE